MHSVAELLLNRNEVQKRLTPLHVAAYCGEKQEVEVLLARGAEIDEKDSNGWAPLHCSADNGHREVVELLLAKGADIEAKGNDGWTALHFAAGRGHREVVVLLIAKGANVKTKDKNGRTAFDHTKSEDIKMLLRKGEVIRN